MTTSYYYLREPISSLRVEDAGPHTRVTVFEEGANVGTLTVRDPRAFLWMFADGSEPAMRAHFGGEAVGVVVTELVRGLDPMLQLISEYGDLRTVADIRGDAAKVKA